MKKSYSKLMMAAGAMLAVFALGACGAAQDAQADLSQAAQTAAATTEAASAAEGESASENRLEAIKAAGKLTVATSPDFAPYEFENISANGEKTYAGSDIELGKYIAEKLGVEFELEPMEFSACQAAVSSGTVDISISCYAPTPERAENMGLSNQYFTTDPEEKAQGILVLKDRAAELSTNEAFAGKTVAAQNGALQQTLVSEQLPEAKMETVTNINDAIMMLQTGKVDGIAIAAAVGEQYMENYPEIVMSDYYFDYQSEGNVVLVQKGQDELLAAVNEAVDAANAEGLPKQWYQDALEQAKALGLDVSE